MALVAPVPTTTKAPTPSQILLLVFMSNPGDDSQNFAVPYVTTCPRAMLIIVIGIRPVTSLFLIILTTKTRRAPESACQVTATACSIVGRPPRNPDANRDRQCALGRGDQARARRAQARALRRRPGNRGLCGAHGQEQPPGRGGAAFARHGPQACGRTRSRQRGLSPRGAAEGALAAPFFALREKHALRQPCRRRADGRHAHRRLVHALPVRTDELRRRRAHDRKRGG